MTIQPTLGGGHAYPSSVWPDLEAVVIVQFRHDIPSATMLDANENPATFPVKVGTATTVDLASWMPYLRVEIIPGGSGDAVVEQTSVMDVEMFASDRGSMWQLASAANASMLRLSKSQYVDLVTVQSPPAYRSYSNPGIFRAVATYELTTRA